MVLITTVVVLVKLYFVEKLFFSCSSNFYSHFKSESKIHCLSYFLQVKHKNYLNISRNNFAVVHNKNMLQKLQINFVFYQLLTTVMWNETVSAWKFIGDDKTAVA